MNHHGEDYNFLPADFADDTDGSGPYTPLTLSYICEIWSSSPGEFHPQALTEPDVSLSTHPALIVQSAAVSRSATCRTGRAGVVRHGQANAWPAAGDAETA